MTGQGFKLQSATSSRTACLILLSASGYHRFAAAQDLHFQVASCFTAIFSLEFVKPRDFFAAVTRAYSSACFKRALNLRFMN